MSDLFSKENEQRDSGQWVNWGKIGDRVGGVYIDRQDYEQKGEPRTDYIVMIKALAHSAVTGAEVRLGESFFHDKDGNKVVLDEGDLIRINHKKGFEKFFKGVIKAGTICGFQYMAEIPVKGRPKPFKQVKSFIPKEDIEEIDATSGAKHMVKKPMYDREWLAENDLTLEDIK